MKRITDQKIINKMFTKYDIKEILNIDLSDNLELIMFEKGEVICNEGDPLNFMSLMVEGKLKVNKIHENGRSLLICIVQDFDIIGDVELIAKTDFSTTATAIEDTYCFVMDLKVYKEQLLNNNAFLRYVSSTLAQALVRNNDVSSFNLLYPLESRLATYILDSELENKFNENLSVLSELLGCSYRQLSRVLAKFCEQKILLKKNHNYLILKKDELEEIANPFISYRI